MSLKQGNRFVPSDDRREIRKLQKATAKCTMLWNQINESLVRNISRKKNISSSLGKWVDQGDDNLVYVNNYGYSTAYAVNGEQRSSKCNKDIELLNETQMRYVIPGIKDHDGHDGAMTPCGVAGHNVMNSVTKTAAWVDVKGVKHIYPAKVWHRKLGACDSKAITVSPAEWSALPSGSEMTEVSVCNSLDVDTKLLIDYNKAIFELRKLVFDVRKNIEGIENAGTELGKVVRAAQMNVSRQMLEQKRARAKIEQELGKRVTLAGEFQNSHITFKSNQLDFMVWTVLSFAVIGLAISALLSPTNRIGDFVLVTIALITVYWCASVIYRNYYFK